MGLTVQSAESHVAEPPVGAAPGAEPLRKVMLLDGEWSFTADAEGAPRTALVPGCWESQFEDLRGWSGTAAYERKLVVPAEWRGRHVFLRFGAVDYLAAVYVNDVLVGNHEGGYTPFECAVHDQLRWGEPNTVRVMVTDSKPRSDAALPDGTGTLPFAEIPHGKQSWYTPISGIWQTVTLEARMPAHIAAFRVVGDVDARVAAASVKLSEEAARTGGTLELTVDVPDGAPPVHPVTIVVAAGQSSADVSVPMPGALLWHPDHPYLYVLRAALRVGGEVRDVVGRRFGLRKVETRDGHVWLNGEPYFLMGALDQAFYPRTFYTPPSEAYLRDQFRKAREMGLNLMRCHIKVPTPLYLDLCDEMGLLVWYEVPNSAVLTEASARRARETFERMVERDAHHPSAVILSIINESWGIDLVSEDQRAWLLDTFKWAKGVAPHVLLVDNSPCASNFHIASDLDDYHVYYNIPDQATRFDDWVRTYAARGAGTYSGFGDAERTGLEPLVVSEFGNWGLPSLASVEEAEGGTPWWFESGSGITQPAGVLDRFRRQLLSRAYGDYERLAVSSQEQEWLALKYQIEGMRRHTEMAGYVVTEFTDLHWESNGLLDFGRKPKAFHDRLAWLQQQDILIPRPERHAYWSGETVRVGVELSRFGASGSEGGRLVWRAFGITGELPVPATERARTVLLGVVEFAAPDAAEPVKGDVQVELLDRNGRRMAFTGEPVVVVPGTLKRWGEGRAAWVHDPLGTLEPLRAALPTIGFRLVDAPGEGVLAILGGWSEPACSYVRSGGSAVLAALSPEAMTVESGLGVRLEDRARSNWWGDWCSSHTWFVPDAFPHLPDVGKFGFEYRHVIPRRVIAGAVPDTVQAGIFVGWLHNPAAYVVKLPVGRGLVVATTFDVATASGTDPISSLLLRCLAAQAGLRA